MTRKLILNWQDENSRRVIPVAELLAMTASGVGPSGAVRYEFGYVEGVREARKLGFQAFIAFPEMDRRYTADRLFPFFQNRVMPTTRPDYLDYVSALGLSPETVNDVDLLGRSEAKRHTDRIEMVLAAERHPTTGAYVTHFLARGVRHVEGAEEVVAAIGPGARLQPELEPTNVVNPRARRLLFEGRAIGYVPDYLVADLDALDASASHPTCTVVRVNPPPAPAHHRVLVRLDAAWPAGFEPFAGAAFKPVVVAVRAGLQPAAM
jgi:hypothetical protein